MKDFILKMLSGRNDVSSKRVTGMYLILVFSFILLFFVVFFIFKTATIPDWLVELIKIDLYGGLVLLGVNVFENIFKK